MIRHGDEIARRYREELRDIDGYPDIRTDCIGVYWTPCPWCKRRHVAVQCEGSSGICRACEQAEHERISRVFMQWYHDES